MKFPIALQLYSVRDDLERDFEGTLRKVKAFGYDGVEFAGLYDKSAEMVKVLCAEFGLIPVSAHIPLASMISDSEIVLAEYARIGCRYVVIPYLTEEYRPGGEKFEEVIRVARVIGEAANKLGMTLLYHNHDFEFTRLNGKYALDILYSEVPSEFLKTELDTCWVHVGGEDPAKYIAKYSGRTPVVHLKDYYGEKNDHMYALIGIDDGDRSKEKSMFEFRPVGSGKLDFPSIIAAAETSGTEWVVVEQDNPSMGLSPLDCAKKSIDYLKTI